MEEKLYFTPAKYGKGVKKRKEKTEKEDKDEKGHRVRNLVFFLLLLVIVVLIILWLLHGKTTTSGQYPENVKNESLTCITTNKKYTILDKIESNDKEIKINGVFNGTETLKSLSLIYTLNYGSESEAYRSEAISHAQLNETLANSGFSSSKFSNKFTRYKEKLIISLTANKNELNEYSAKYFEIVPDESGQIPNSLSELRKKYEANGFKCNSSEDN